MTTARSLVLAGIDHARRRSDGTPPSSSASPTTAQASPLPEPRPPAPMSPSELGLRDAAIGGWFNRERGELCPGYPIGSHDIIADVGCGDGGYSRFCASLGASTTAVDISPDAVARAKEMMRSEPGAVTVIQSDGNPLPLQSEFATQVICTQVLEHVDDPQAFLAELVRIGKRGALYLLSVPDPVGEEIQKHVGPPGYFQKPNHIRIFQRQEFGDLITAAGLQIEKRAYYFFFWAMWWSLAMPLKIDMKNPSHPVMDAWLTMWSELLKTPEGLVVKNLLDGVMPKDQVVIARKP